MKKSFFIYVLFLSFFAHAQERDSSHTSFKLSVNYNSNLNYYGRTDSLKSTGLFPLAEWWFNQHFYVNAAPVFVNNKLQSFAYAGTIVTAGYQNITEKWLTNLYALKPFYKESSALVQSALKGQAGITVSHLNPLLNLTAGADIKFSDKTDYGITGGLDHIVRFESGSGSVVVLDPSFFVYAGTQNFSTTYYKKSGLPLLPPSQGNKTVQQFSVLAFEWMLPVIYAKDAWMLTATPSYISPQNLITVEGRPDLSERGESLFYFALGLKRSF
jgi:hypothetical protein